MPWPDNVTLIVEAAFGDGPTDEPSAWTNIVSDVRSLTTFRGRQSVRSHFDAGSAILVVDNTSGNYDPNNTAGTHYPNMRVGLPIRVRATHDLTTYTIFRGSVDRIPLRYDQPNDSTATLELIERYESLRNDQYDDSYSFAQESAADRIDDILDLSIGASAARSLSGDTQVSALTHTGAAGTLIDDTVEAEQGTFFLAADGTFTLYDRTHYASATADATFGGGSGLDYSNPQFTYDRDHLINRVNLTGADAELVKVNDNTSQSNYGKGAIELGTDTNVSLLNSAHALNVAEWLVAKFKDVVVRITEFSVFPEVDEANLYPEVLGRDLGDVLRVIYSPPAGDDIDQTCKIEKVRHEIRPGSWETVFGVYPLSAQETADYWILGTSTLDTSTVLA